jgi:inner membrane protein
MYDRGMDNLCHTLVGAAFGEAGLKYRTRFGNAVLMVAANLPDVDALGFASAVPSVAFRRGWTHGVLAQALLPIALTAAALAVDRWWRGGPSAPRARAGALLLLSYVGVLSHVGLDYLNNYGVRLLMPFSNRWFYGDAVFIVDPWLWLVLAAGVWLARRGSRPRRAAVALGVAAIYIGLMVVSAVAARRAVLAQWMAARGRQPEALMVGPRLANPLHKEVIIDVGEEYARGRFTWPEGRLVLRDRMVPSRENDPVVRRAQKHAPIAWILVWVRFPYYDVEAGGQDTRVTIRDLRFGNAVGRATVTLPD